MSVVVRRTTEHTEESIIEQTVRLLGKRMKDKVTEFEGVAASVSIDLYGCIQIILSPKHTPESKSMDAHGRIFDVNRLVVTDETRVMEPPDSYFQSAAPETHEHGPAERPEGYLHRYG